MSEDHPDFDDMMERYRESVAEECRIELEAHRETIERFQEHCHRLGLDLTDSDQPF